MLMTSICSDGRSNSDSSPVKEANDNKNSHNKNNDNSPRVETTKQHGPSLRERGLSLRLRPHTLSLSLPAPSRPLPPPASPKQRCRELKRFAVTATRCWETLVNISIVRAEEDLDPLLFFSFFLLSLYFLIFLSPLSPPLHARSSLFPFSPLPPFPSLSPLQLLVRLFLFPSPLSVV